MSVSEGTELLYKAVAFGKVMELILNAAYVTFLETVQGSLDRAREDGRMGESVNRRASQS